MINEFVMLNSESTDWIAGKFVVLNTTLTGAGTGFAWIKRISYGLATEQDMTDYVASYNNGDGVPDKSKLKGSLGEYQVVAITDIKEHRKNALRVENFPPSVVPVG